MKKTTYIDVTDQGVSFILYGVYYFDDADETGEFEATSVQLADCNQELIHWMTWHDSNAYAELNRIASDKLNRERFGRHEPEYVPEWEVA